MSGHERSLTKALNSCVWVLNNRHNAGDPRWHELAEAAMKDAREALALVVVAPAPPAVTHTGPQ